MRLSPRIGTLTFGVALACAAVLPAAAPPAYAAGDAAIHGETSGFSTINVGSPGKATLFHVTGRNAVHPRLVLDVTHLYGQATIDAARGCAQSGTRMTCEFPTVADLNTTLSLVVHPTAKASVGSNLSFEYGFFADNVPGDPNQLAQAVTFNVGEGSDLLPTTRIDQITGERVGDRVATPMTLENVGGKAATGIQIAVTSSHGLVLDTYDNCAYGEENPYTGQLVVVCEWPDVTVAPGSAWRVKDGFGSTVAADAAARETISYYVGPLGPPPGNFPRDTLHKRTPTGRTLALVPFAGRSDDSPNYGYAAYLVDGSHFDVAMQGAQAAGKVGDTVKVKVGPRNNGPATLNTGTIYEDALTFFVTLPPGTDATGIVRGCDPQGSRTYICRSGMFLGVGATTQVELTLKITKVISDARGTVSTHDPDGKLPDLVDDDAANNTAAIVLNPTTPAGGTAGGTGGSTGGGGTAGGTGGGLPVTGTNAALIAGGGVLAVVVGGLIYFFARRRRVILVVEEEHTA